MSIFDTKGRVAAAAQELADTLSVTERIKELQEAQKIIQGDLNELNQKVDRLDNKFKSASAEIRLEVMREVKDSAINIQSTIFDKVNVMSIEIDRLKNGELTQNSSESVAKLTKQG